MATLVTDTLNSKEVTVDAWVAERAPWRIRTEEGDHVPAVLVDRARVERLRQAVAELAVYADRAIASGRDTPCSSAIRERLRGISEADLDALP